MATAEDVFVGIYGGHAYSSKSVGTSTDVKNIFPYNPVSEVDLAWPLQNVIRANLKGANILVPSEGDWKESFAPGKITGKVKPPKISPGNRIKLVKEKKDEKKYKIFFEIHCNGVSDTSARGFSIVVNPDGGASFLEQNLISRITSKITGTNYYKTGEIPIKGTTPGIYYKEGKKTNSPIWHYNKSMWSPLMDSASRCYDKNFINIGAIELFFMTNIDDCHTVFGNSDDTTSITNNGVAFCSTVGNAIAEGVKDFIYNDLS